MKRTSAVSPGGTRMPDGQVAEIGPSAPATME